jgi:hypothetical protein
MGTDGNDIQWACEADLDEKYRFGKLEVVCEGYENALDPYILKGSCGLEYNLELTDQGRMARQYKGSAVGYMGWLLFLFLCIGCCSGGGGGGRSRSGGGPGFWTGAAVGSALGGSSSRSSGYRYTSSRRATGYGGTRRR